MLFHFDVLLLLKLYLCANKASMDPKPANSDVYLLDEHRFAKIDASRVISFLRFKFEYYNNERTLFLLIIFSYNCKIFTSV